MIRSSTVGVKSTRYAQFNNLIPFRPFYVTANAYNFSPMKRRIKDTFISSEMSQKSRTAIWVLKNFPRVSLRTPNNGRKEEKGGVEMEEGLGKGERVGRG
jgi:hypothetical protein